MPPRRFPTPGILVLLLALLLAACGNPSGVPPTQPSSAPTVAASSPVSGQASGPPDTLRWSIEGVSDLPSLDPAKPQDSQSITVIALVFGGLIRLDDKLEVQPDGASEYNVSAD